MSNKAATSPRTLKLTADGVQNITIFGIFLIACVVGFMLEPKLFFSPANVTSILVSASSVIIVASAVTFVLISGNLNLSVGGTGAMGAVLFGLMAKNGVPIPAALLLTVGIGLLCGLLCGFIIAQFKLPSFIVSLAFRYITRGIALVGASGAVVFGLPVGVEQIGKTIGKIPLPAVYAIVVVLIFIWLQNKTVFASETYAVGANESAAHLSGISNRKVVMASFAMSGLLAAFVGVVITSRFSAADSGILANLDNDCIIAAVLGGTDINGGRGTVFGMLMGALFIVVLTNIMNMLGMTTYTQDMVKGIVLIGAILLNNIIRKRARI